MFWTIAAYEWGEDTKCLKQFRFDSKDEAVSIIKKWCLDDGVTEEEFNEELYCNDDECFKEFYGESGVLYELRVEYNDRYRDAYQEYKEERSTNELR